MEEKSIKTRGLKTVWIGNSKPSQPIILFLHGFPDTPETWKNQLEYFAKDYEVVAPYTRGVGPSEKPKDSQRHSTHSLALDYIEILKKVDPSLERPIFVVGHDIGAAHAWTLVEMLGSKVHGVCLIDGMPLRVMLRRLKNYPQLIKSWYIWLAQVPFLSDGLSFVGQKKFIDLAHWLGGLQEPSVSNSAKSSQAFMNSIMQYKKFFRSIPSQWIMPKQCIDVPVLVVWGNSDRLVNVPCKEDFAGFASNVNIRQVKANHWPHVVLPEVVNGVMGEFFERGRL